jgi:hypothetical protein
MLAASDSYLWRKHMAVIDQDAARLAHQEVSTGRLINGAHS